MSSALHIITSNHLEVLAAGLAELVQTEPEHADAHPLRPESVLVQSKGMQRWLSMAVAGFNGICANFDFPFPNAFLEKLYTRLVAPSAFDPYDVQNLGFQIMRLLPGLLDQKEFEPLRIYLAQDFRSTKLYQLAFKIADTFDQYAVFRPDMLLAWEAGKKEGAQSAANRWQSRLWRCLTSEIQSTHRAQQHRELIRQLKDPSRILKELPARISIFGISYLPPYHLEVFEALACRIPVYLFLLNPCRQYWSQILSDHQMIRVRTARERKVADTTHLHLERGNRLLSSLGLLGRHFFDFIHQQQAYNIEAFRDNPQTLLGTIQQDILDLVDRAQPDFDPVADDIKADGTLRIQSCHSPMREVEVLYDQLLEMMSCDLQIQPRDILVMVPDIGSYAPYIHAVFGRESEHRTRIPYAVADQSILQESTIIESFIQLMDLIDSRFEATRVVALLENPAVHQRFGLTKGDLDIIEDWIGAAGIRWGWNAADRRRNKLPGFKENTWQAGLDRLILGYAMASDQQRLFKDTLPFDPISVGDGQILGKLVLFLDQLRNTMHGMGRARTLIEWRAVLSEWITCFFQPHEQSERELRALQGVIDHLEKVGFFGHIDQGIPFEVIRQYIKDALSRINHEGGFIAGGITFCAMLPMRSIPARVICLLGMNHDAFPREQFEPGFNLITAEPRSGDRSKRHDDRYLFLETIISARQILYLSYIGQNIQDNATIPPSVVVDELIEYVQEGFAVPANELITVHPLHAFSPAYFDGNQARLFSYSENNRDAAARLRQSSFCEPFFDTPLAPPDDPARHCEWVQLSQFFQNPARYILENRLGVRMRAAAEKLSDRENFLPEALDRYHLDQQLLRAFAIGSSPEQTYQLVRAAGLLPHGKVGEIVHQQLSRDVQHYLRSMAQFMPDEKPHMQPVELVLPPFSMHGMVDNLNSRHRLVCRLGKMRPSDMLSAFIFHLALLLAPESGVPKQTILVCKDHIWQFGPVTSPEKVLKSYLDLYWEGMQIPLPFFPRSSFEYAHQLMNRRQSSEVALAAAVRKWQGSDFGGGEANDPYFVRCFSDKNPMTAQFEATALSIFAPLLIAGGPLAAGDQGQSASPQ